MRPRVLPFLTFLLLTGTPAYGQEREYLIDTFDVRLELLEDGSYLVEESVTFEFVRGSFTQGFRSIPGRRIDEIRILTVRSPDTEVSEIEHERDGRDHLIVWTFPERTEPATFLLTYEVTGALVADGQENVIDWNAVGRDVEVQIRELRVEILWPDLGFSRAEIRHEPEEEAVLERLADAWLARFTHGDLPPRTPYRAVVAFPQRIEGRAPPAPAWYFLVGALGFLFALIPGVASYQRARPSVQREVSAAVPEVSIPEAGFLLGDSLSFATRTFAALLFDLARRGHVSLHHTERKRWSSTEERLEVELHPQQGGLSEFEQAFVDRLSEYDSFQQFLSEGWRFQFEAAKSLRGQLVDRGLMVDGRPRSNRQFVLAAVAGTVGVAVSLVLSGWAMALALGLTGGAVLGAAVAGSTRYPITEEGAVEKARAKAFIDDVRTGIEDTLESDPVESARRLLEHLPWLFLDAKVAGAWLDKFEEAMDEAGEDIELPAWIKSAVGGESASRTSALISTIAVAHVSGGSGAGSVAGAGAGGVGGAGGGGVGAR